MDTKIQFQKNAAVLTANGEQVGSLNRVVVDLNTRELAGIVIGTGSLFNEKEVVLPIEMVAETTGEQVILSKNAGDIKSFPLFEEEHIVDTEEQVEHAEPELIVQPMLYGSPVFGTPLQTTVGRDFVTRLDQNIPEGTIALKEGAKVMSADGKHVGDVERVFTGIPNEKITHLLVSRGKLQKKTKLVPIDWVDSMNEDEVNLRVKKVSVDSLADTMAPR